MHRTSLIKLFLTAWALTILPATGALACLHLREGDLDIRQSRQRALVFWEAGRQELILSVDYEMQATSGRPASAVASAADRQLAWVIPLPSMPDAYAESTPGLIDAAAEEWEAHRPRVAYTSPGGPGITPSPAYPPRLKLLKPVQAGAYQIQPIKTQGAGSERELNDWLKGSGFAPVDPANMRYYVKRDWTWLAIKADLPKSAKGRLRPLRISFASEEIVYPLKFSSHQGVFALELYVVTSQPLGGYLEGKVRHTVVDPQGFYLQSHRVHLVGALAAAGSKVFPGFQEGAEVVMTRVTHSEVNRLPVANWKRDFVLQPKSAAGAGSKVAAPPESDPSPLDMSDPRDSVAPPKETNRPPTETNRPPKETNRPSASAEEAREARREPSSSPASGCALSAREEQVAAWSPWLFFALLVLLWIRRTRLGLALVALRP